MHRHAIDVSDVSVQHADPSDIAWRELVHQAPEGLMVCEVVETEDGRCDFRHLYVNPAWERVTGLEPSQVLGLTAREAFPELEPAWIEALLAVVAEPHRGSVVRYLAVIDRWYDVSAFAMGGGRFGLMFIDVSERERIESRLTERSEAMSRRLTSTVSRLARTWQVTPDLLSVFDTDGCFMHANPAWASVLGWSNDALIGKSFKDLLHPDHRDRSVAEFEQLVATGEPVLRFEDRYRHADGSFRWLSWVAVPEGDAIYCSARDVTADRERAEKLAERNRIWLGSRDLYVTIGTDGDYRELNPAWLTELGYTPEKLVGTRFDELVRPDARDRVRGEFVRMASGEHVVDCELPTRAADGRYLWYSWSGFLEDGLILVMGRNIEQRKAGEAELERAGDALRQAQKLEMIGQLTGGVAHDFNNLLMAVQANLDVLGESLDPSQRDARELLDNALEGIVRGAALTQRMLAFARRQELSPGAVAVPALLDGMRDLLARTLGPGIVIQTRFEPELPAARVDANQLEMALLNLAVNARDAMGGSGTLDIAVDVQQVGSDSSPAPGRYVRIAVSDSGEGMDEATLERAAEPFFTTKAIGEGTGLGLSMVHGLAEQSQGAFTLRSVAGAGLTAEILLPALDASDAIEPPRTAAAAIEHVGGDMSRPAANHERARILVVDDDPLVLHGIARMLEHAGHRVTRAASAREALELLDREPRTDLLLTDYAMPDVNGLDLAHKVRERGATFPIVLASGYAASGAATDRRYVTASLRKPFTKDRLAAVVDELLAR